MANNNVSREAGILMINYWPLNLLQIYYWNLLFIIRITIK